MAYFNYRLAESRGLSPRDVQLLQMLKQNKTEDLSEQLQLEMDTENIKRLKAFDLMTMIKGKKKDTEFQKLRLSKKGNKWLNDLQTADTVDNDFQMFEYAKKVYKQLNKDIGDETNTISLIAWFRCETGMSHKQIFIVLDYFVKDDSQMNYSNVLEYVFWKRPHIHAVKPSLKDSRLWGYYNKHKNMFDTKFLRLNEQQETIH